MSERRIPYMKLVRYWRACVADSTLKKGRFRRRELPPNGTHFLELSGDELAKGRLDGSTIRKLFTKVDSAHGKGPGQEAEVCFWPVWAARKTSHRVGRGDSKPECVLPIVSVGRVSRDDGRLWPARTVIARDVLEPLPDGVFSVGTVEDLDRFLRGSPFSSLGQDTGHEETWEQYRAACEALLETVTGGWPCGDGEYERIDKGVIEVAGDPSAMVRGTLELYDSIVETAPQAPLLDTWAVRQSGSPVPVPGSGEGSAQRQPFAGRLGHSNDAFPLADKQRDVLACMALAQEGEVLAVNGPPGTGKTTMLLSAIAGEWVRAARAGGDPPVVAAASTNNQAVTNIIDAFGKDFAQGEGPFAGRWLPDIGSLGLYLPSRSREEEARKRGYQTEGFFESIESRAYVRKAKAAFLAKANAAFPELNARDASTVVEALRERLDREVRKLEAVDAALAKRDAAQAKVESALGDRPVEALAALGAQRVQLEQEKRTHQGLLERWEDYLAGESIFLLLFAFLLAVARKRALKARRFLSGIGYSGPADGARLDVDGMDAELRGRLDEANERLEAVDARLSRGKAAMDGLRRASREFECAAKVVAGGGEETDVAALERLADCGVRFDLFRLATHYWEGRWLCAMEELLPDIDKERKRKGKKSVVPRWRRRMMLTPCMVSTFATLPGKMKATRYVNGFEDEFLFSFIDLLIVDEAGQVQPEAAGGAFALARKALVIGDTQQIEPIASLPRSVDTGNLVESGVLSPDHTDEDLKRVHALGVCSTGGSAMQAAQSACRYAPVPELGRGLWLFEHRRCYDEIVEYCNALCYRGKLEPKRGGAGTPDEEAAALGPLGYLHVDGYCGSAGGSRRNTAEAETIAAWLKAQRGALEGRYAQPLEKIVGVVTPFGAQVRAIRAACRTAGIKVDGRGAMTVGTVHALQGADRNVVVFSPAYSKHGDGGFIDKSPSMLNVAVSRARDAFLVFGDMDLFSTAEPGSPRQLLGEFLFGEPANALEFGALPRDDLAPAGRETRMLRDAQEHDAFLRDVLADRSLGRLCIVSPWIVVGTMERAGILSAMQAARSRGAQIDVYVDPELSAGEGATGPSNLERARATLEPMGIGLNKVRRIHSKIVMGDESLLCVGSFNWLSARRSGKYARHETSVVYKGSHLADEIGVIIASLAGRGIGGEHRAKP